MTQRPFGLALGAGGARGLAHLVVLQTLDELGLRPAALAGSSMGAVLGTLYASGLTAAEIRGRVDRVLATESRWPLPRPRDLLTFATLLDPVIGPAGLLRGERLVARILEPLGARRFEDLQIPMRVVAADLESREELVFERGPLLPALRASMSMPAVLSPARHEGRLLIDGGTVNPVPYDRLGPDCVVRIGVDVIGTRSEVARPRRLTMLGVLLRASQVMESRVAALKRMLDPPDVYLQPELHDIGVLDFHRAAEIYAHAEALRATFAAELRAAIGTDARVGADEGFRKDAGDGSGNGGAEGAR